jgi:hypothetical protein
MLFDEIWVVTITNDGTTILKQIEVTHLATKFTENQVPVLISIEIPETTEISILKEEKLKSSTRRSTTV